MVIFNALQSTLSGGIGRYCYELSKAIYEINEIDFKIVIREEDRHLFLFAKDKDLIVINGIKNGKDRNYYEQFVLPKMIYNKYKDVVIHYPDSMAPIISKNKIIITIHDLAFLSRSSDFTKKTALWKKIITNLSVRKADKIICITNFAQKEFVKFYPKYSEKSLVVYNGFNDFSKAPIDMQKIGGTIRNTIGQKYILTVSTISPRKNIDGLIKAFKSIEKNTSHKLVVAGGNGWLYEDIYKVVDNLSLKNRVIFTGKINDEELKALYKNADLFVYPSFYEGFGLPPLEAMSYGVPCVVSNVTSMPEVVGDSAVFIAPNSVDDMSNKILSTISDSNLREDIVDKGFRRLKGFSWGKCAEDTIEVYKSVIK